MILQSHECVLCNQHSRETLEHLFFDMSFRHAVLGILGPPGAGIPRTRSSGLFFQMTTQHPFFHGDHNLGMLGHLDVTQ